MRQSVLALLLLISGSGLAQYPLVRSFEVRDGQRRPRITALAQDQRGLIWAAAEIGVLRTDGEVVDVMWRTQGERITALAAHGNEVVFVTDQGRLVRCDGLACDTLLQDSLIASSQVSIVAADDARVIGTYGHGVLMERNGALRVIDTRAGLPDDHVNGLAALPDGRIAVATDQGLALLEDGVVRVVMDEPAGAPDNLVLSIDVAEDGAIWAGTHRAGVFRWKPEANARPQTLASSWSLGPVDNVRATGTMIWASTRDAGPVVIDQSLENGTYRQDWTGRAEVLDLLRDSDGAIWWCDGSDMLQRADPAFLFVPEHEGLDLRNITALCSDARQSIWFATAEGIYRHVTWFSEERKVTRVPVDIDPRTPVVSLAAGPDGTIWAGTFGAGAFAIAPDGRITSYTSKDGLSNDNVLSVRSTSTGVVLATLAGVTRIDGHELKQTGAEAGFVFDAVMDGERLLMATDGKGIVIAEANGDVHAERAQETFYSLAFDAEGRPWSIGPGTGFCPVNDTARGIGAELAPFDGEVFSLGQLRGRLVAFGSTGVTAYDPASGTLSDVTSAFGLRDIAAELNAIATDHAGALWLACSKGLVRMRTRDSHFKPRPVVALLDARINGAVQGVAGGIVTPHDRNAVLLRFTAPYWADPAALRFQYRLKGYGDRIEETRDRQVSFAALPPGDYLFQVRAVVSHGGADAPWTELQVTVMPPWWRIPWVMILLGVVLIGMVAMALRARDRRARYRDRMEQEKVRFQLDALRSQVDPHFLFNSFNALVELIESEPTKAVEHVEQLSTFFRNILQVRDRERISVKEELHLLDTYFALEQRRFGSAIALRVEADAAALERAMVPLTLQMLVENALKHNVVTGGAPFVIEVRASAEAIEVRNPVRPRATPPRSTGFGLESIVKRYAALTERPIQAGREGGDFVVRIPLIELIA